MISQRPVSNLRAWLHQLEGPRVVWNWRVLGRGIPKGVPWRSHLPTNTAHVSSSFWGPAKPNLEHLWELSIFAWLRAPARDSATAPPHTVIGIIHGGLGVKKRVDSFQKYCLKIVPEGKRKMRDENRNKYRSFKSWERGMISWDTHRENLTSCGQAGRD